MHIDTATVAALISGAVSPFVIAVLVKAHASEAVKRTTAYVFALLAGVLPTVVWDPATGWRGYLGNLATALVMQQVVHRTKVTDKLEAATPGVIGGQPPAEPPPVDLVVPPAGNPGDIGDLSSVGEQLA